MLYFALKLTVCRYPKAEWGIDLVLGVLSKVFVNRWQAYHWPVVSFEFGGGDCGPGRETLLIMRSS
jgi:hypothetical protein